MNIFSQKSHSGMPQSFHFFFEGEKIENLFDRYWG